MTSHGTRLQLWHVPSAASCHVAAMAWSRWTHGHRVHAVRSVLIYTIAFPVYCLFVAAHVTLPGLSAYGSPTSMLLVCRPGTTWRAYDGSAWPVGAGRLRPMWEALAADADSEGATVRCRAETDEVCSYLTSVVGAVRDAPGSRSMTRHRAT